MKIKYNNEHNRIDIDFEKDKKISKYYRIDGYACVNQKNKEQELLGVELWFNYLDNEHVKKILEVINNDR